MNNPKLAIIIPCFNEQEVIALTIETLLNVLDRMIKEEKISADSFLYLVNDGSQDETWQIIEKMHEKNGGKVKALSFTKNFGNQNAILAGLLAVKELDVDCALTIDADLQQDENKIDEFVEHFKNGSDIVCGIRKNRNTDMFFKKWTAILFYKLVNLLGAKITPNHSDYRLVSKRVLDILSEYKEVNLFLRGVFTEFGLKTTYVKFDVKPRQFGTSKFTVFALFSLAMQGITSFSIIPLRMVSILGILISTFSFFLGISVIIEKLTHPFGVPGWATIVSVISFTGGIQILCLGIIGEYLGQLFQEVKARPRYIKGKELV